MAVPDTTQRLTGFGGTAHCGETQNGSDIYNSADIEEWEAEVQTDTIDMTGGNDAFKVYQYGPQGASGTIKKMVVSATFVARALSKPVVYLALRLGVAPGGTPGSGDLVLSGLAILDRVALQNAKHNKVLENVAFTYTGDPTPSA